MGVSCTPVQKFKSSVQVSNCRMPLGQPESADDPAVHIAIIAVVKISGNSSGGALKFSLNSFHCPDNFWVFGGRIPKYQTANTDESSVGSSRERRKRLSLSS